MAKLVHYAILQSRCGKLNCGKFQVFWLLLLEYRNREFSDNKLLRRTWNRLMRNIILNYNEHFFKLEILESDVFWMLFIKKTVEIYEVNGISWILIQRFSTSWTITRSTLLKLKENCIICQNPKHEELLGKTYGYIIIHKKWLSQMSEV